MSISIVMYFIKHDYSVKMFETLNYPGYLVYGLAIAKLLGVVTIWANKSKMLKEWAYAGFFFNFILAFAAHVMVGDGEFAGALMGMVILIISYIFNRKINPNVSIIYFEL